MEVDSWAIVPLMIIAVAVASWLYWSGAPVEPHITFSSLDNLTFQGTSWRLSMRKLPQYLLWAALALLLLAFIDPHRFVVVSSGEVANQASAPSQAAFPPAPTRGSAIYLILDQSGSMEEKVSMRLPDGSVEEISKLNLLKKFTKDFIEARPNDLIGMISFARTPQVLSPLTLDHATLLKLLANLDIMRIKDQDGTGIGYAIFKTSNIITATKHFAERRAVEGKPTYDIKQATIVLVTDGLQDTNPLDEGNAWRTIGVEEAAKVAAKQDVRLYAINVEPQLASEKYAPQRRAMEASASLTGGHFYMVEHPENLQKIYSTLDVGEKSTIPQLPQSGGEGAESQLPPRRISYFWPLILLSLVCMAVATILEALWIRSLP